VRDLLRYKSTRVRIYEEKRKRQEGRIGRRR
jgi:hypothetical protein